MPDQSIVWLNQCDKEDTALVGVKAANLGEMTGAGLQVPNGFIVTTHAFNEFIKYNDLDKKYRHLINTVNFEDHSSLSQISSIIKREFIQGELPADLKLKIYSSYKKLGGLSEAQAFLCPSFTSRDLPQLSFIVSGDTNLIHKIKEIWSSLYDEKAILQRHKNKFENHKIALAVIVQKIPDSAKSGDMFTIDPSTNDKNRIIINAVYGLKEITEQSGVHDHYEVDKKDNKILTKDSLAQSVMLKHAGAANKRVKVSMLLKNKQKLTDKQILELARFGKKVEKYYFFPQEIEWSIEEDGKIYLVRTKPLTALGNDKSARSLKFSSEKPVLKGIGVNPGIATGHVRLVDDFEKPEMLRLGEVLVLKQANPVFVPAMKKVCAIITETNGKNPKSIALAHDIGIPVIFEAKNASELLQNGMIVTVNGLTGEIFSGGKIVSSEKSEIEEKSPQTATKVFMNISDPIQAEKYSTLHCDGIGLLGAEFIMTRIGSHPKKMIRDGKKNEYIKELAKEIEKVCSVFSPRPVVYRVSDFKTNEYRNLIGGKEFEPVEPNPALGLRGAFRYIHDPEVFKLELEAVRYIRDKKKLTNLWLMIPYVRTPKEFLNVKKIIKSSGLTRTNTFKIWMSVEIPANVVLLEDFIRTGIDGISIDTNDLTMLMLGTDRDNSEIASEFNERNPAVLWALDKIVRTATKNAVTVSVCGQAAIYPEILQTVVEAGATSVSVPPDFVGSVRELIAEKEEKIFGQR